MERLLMPIKGGVITQHFLDKSAADDSHIHGALDFGAPIGTPILAPEDGYIFGYQSIRSADGLFWLDLPKVHEFEKFAFSNYFYDMYGGVTVLESLDGTRTHLFCHSYANQILNKIFESKNKYYVEERENKRFPLFALYTEKIKIKKGSVIGYVGAAGKCIPAGPQGAHLHWEIHPGKNVWKTYNERINPELLLEEK